MINTRQKKKTKNKVRMELDLLPKQQHKILHRNLQRNEDIGEGEKSSMEFRKSMKASEKQTREATLFHCS